MALGSVCCKEYGITNIYNETIIRKGTECTSDMRIWTEFPLGKTGARNGVMDAENSL